MTMYKVVSASLFLCFVGYSTMGEPGRERPRLVPAPREIKQGSRGDFIIQPATRIFLSSENAEDRFAAEQLQAELKHLAGCDVGIEAAPPGPPNGPGIYFARAGNVPVLENLLQKDGLRIESDFSPEGYALNVDSNHVLLTARGAEGIFYGAQTLRQLLSGHGAGKAHFQGSLIRDWPALKWRGIMDDVNRGPVPTLDYMKKQIRTIAAYKLNLYSPYVEILWQSRKHPLINPYGATLTPEEMRELIAYALPYHVQILPQQQCFGHLHGALQYERYSDLSERPHSQILSPANEKSYEFISDLLSEVMPVFPCEFFHVGCDETFELGKGRSKERVEKEGLAKVYTSHLARVNEIAKPYGKKLLFWGDVAFEHPEALKDVPEGMIAVAWGYGVNASYESRVIPLEQAHIPFMVSPSAYYRALVTPDFMDRALNIRNFARDGQKHGAIGLLNTAWDDVGEELFEMIWHGVVFGAAAAWQPGESSIDRFNQDFDWAFYRNDDNHAFADALQEMSLAHTLLRTNKIGSGGSVSMFWADPFSRQGARVLQPIRPDVARALRLHAEQAITLIEQNRSKARINAETLDTLVYGARRIDYIGMKVQCARDLQALYVDSWKNPSDSERLKWNMYDSTIPYASRLADLRWHAMELKMRCRDLWRQECRPYYLDILMARFDRILHRIDDQEDRYADALHQRSRTGSLPAPEDVNLFLK